MMKFLLKYALLFLMIYAYSINDIKAQETQKADGTSTDNISKADKAFSYYVNQSYKYYKRNKEVQKQYLDSAYLYLAQVNDETTLPIYYTSYGHYYYNSGKFDSAIISYRKVFNYIDTTKLYKYIQAMTHIGRVFSRLDQYDSTLFYYTQSTTLLERLDSSDLIPKLEFALANTYNNLGSLYLNMGSYDESVTYYYKALKIYEKTNNKVRSTVVLLNLGNIYLFHKEYDKALVEYDKAIIILDNHPGKRINTRANLFTNMGLCFKANNQLDTAIVYYEKALAIRKKIGPKRSISGLYDNIGNLEKAKGNYDKALSYYSKALNIRKEGGGARDIASSYGNIGLLYAETKTNPRKAIKYLSDAIEISGKNSFVEISLVCIQGMSQVYKDLGNYKEALNYYIEYRELNDSIHSLRLEEKLTKYKQKYESEKKDRLIERLEEDKKLADALEKKQKLVNEKQRITLNALIGIAVLLLIILILLQRYFKMKRESDRKLFEKTEQLNQQKTLELMKELEMSSFKSFIEGQEKERSRIAGDLHDRLGSLLSTVRLHFDSLGAALKNNPDALASHEFALKLLDNSVQEVRAVSRNLTKGVLTQFGLIAAVENMRDAINAAGKIRMEVFSSGVTSRLDSEVEINLFRVIQELITNVIRHAQTNEVFVQFTGAGTHFSIMVEDHGIGFDTENVKSNGIGMSSLKNRVRTVGGTFEIDSKIGQGTTIIIDVPYLSDESDETKKDENNEDSKKS